LCKELDVQQRVTQSWQCTSFVVGDTGWLSQAVWVLRAAASAQACEAAAYLEKLPDRIRKLAERSNARKQKNKGQTSPFAWVFDRPVELL
jgi:hypothetical protein